MLMQLITSNIFWSILAASLIAQGAKILVLIFKKKEKFQWSDLFVTGNMPSGHSALVTALTVSVLLTEGFSPLFFVSFVFAAVVIRDAVGVRRAVGEEGKVLSNIITVLKNRFHITIPRKMHQSLGHQPLEVFVGVLIGILSSVLMYGYFY
jgi:acid phosphatase family membrane protein YuiD